MVSPQWTRVTVTPFRRGPKGVILFGVPSVLFLIALFWLIVKDCHFEAGNNAVCHDGGWLLFVLIAWIIFTVCVFIQIFINLYGKPFSNADIEQGIYEEAPQENSEPAPAYRSLS